MAYTSSPLWNNNEHTVIAPAELADNIDGIAPSGLCIMSVCYIVEKMDVAICNGKDQWYAYSGGTIRCIAAGQPWSALFNT